ncbi:MAG TPA: hypothetical protein VJ576_02560 [Rhodocyclaceae bacterium]|nr:hypothetical protein [Rhodocyclaceae bacterium]
MTIHLADITVAVDDAGTTQTLRFGTDAFCSARTDAPADTAWRPFIKDPGSIEQHMFDEARTSGTSRIGFGVLELVNADGALDALMDYGFDGRPLTLRAVEPGAALASAVDLVTLTMQQAEFGKRSISIRVRDLQAALAVTLASTTYAGTNVLPAGLEGTADDLKGQPKPRLYGTVQNIAPPCVNTARLIYQVHDGAVQDIAAVYDQAVALTRGADYLSQADMEATAPAAGAYRAWLGGGCFRLGSSPAGQVTADASRGATAADRCVAKLLQAVALDAYPAVSINAADVTALATAASGEAGHWVASADSALQVMDELAGSVGAWFGFDAAGALRLGQLQAPAGVASLTLGAIEIVDLDRVANNDTANGLPVWRVRLQYGRLYTVQTTDLAGAVSAARRAELAKEYREATVTRAAVKTKHPLAGELERRSLLLASADADAEASRLLDLYGVDRHTWKVEARLTAAQIGALALGMTVRLVFPRFGLAGGKNFVLIGMVRELESSRATLWLWG